MKKLAARERIQSTLHPLAEIFDHDPKNRVADKEKSHQHSVRLSRASAEPQNRKQDNAFEKGFVRVATDTAASRIARRASFTCGCRWTAATIASGVVSEGINLGARRNCTVRFCRVIEQFFWKLYRPWTVGNATVKLAVNEIGAAAKEQTNRRCYAEIVAKIPPRNFMPMRVVKREE